MTKRELDFIEITKKLMDAMGVREKDVRDYFSGEEKRLEDRKARQYLSHNLIRFKKDLDTFLRFKKSVDGANTKKRVEFMGLQRRVQNSLINAEIEYVDELKTMTEHDLFKLKGMGVTGIKEIGKKIGWSDEYMEGIKYERLKK